ncbi:MAG TPA: hypothetical protein VHJ34_02510 [Actinomycetota bacterium]|nr:hypothetical protein [Actinomycetota bacterium]
MSDTDVDDAHDFERYKMLLELWSRENPIKTTKLQVLLAVNALLASVSALGDGLTDEKTFVYAAGFTFSLVWTFSIGRTSLFQEAWNRKLNKIAGAHPDDPRFWIHDTRAECKETPKLLQTLGGIPSKWYLLFAPVAFSAVWLVILVAANVAGS